MLKKTLNYEDYDGNPGEVTIWFNLTEAELTQMMLSAPDQDLKTHMESIVNSGDGAAIIDLFDWIVEKSYGVREGDLFHKDKAAYLRFKAHPAYSEFFMGLVTSAEASADFVTGLMPAKLTQKIEEASQELMKKPQDHLPKAAPTEKFVETVDAPVLQDDTDPFDVDFGSTDSAPKFPV